MEITDEMKKAWDEYIETVNKENEEIAEKYPLDVPNKASNKAVITGVFIENKRCSTRTAIQLRIV